MISLLIRNALRTGVEHHTLKYSVKCTFRAYSNTQYRYGLSGATYTDKFRKKSQIEEQDERRGAACVAKKKNTRVLTL